MTDREVILITGTRKGIGEYLAHHFTHKGALVEGCSRRQINWKLQHYTHHSVDITDEAQVRAMFASIRKRHGRLDITINNAAIASLNHALLTPFRTASRIMDINVAGMFLVCRESVKLMQPRKYGRIVNIGSIVAPLHIGGESLYGASKAAVVTFTKILAREVAGLGITCNVVGPSVIDTDMTRHISKDRLNTVIKELPSHRMGKYEDIAHAIDFFVSPSSDYVTGQVIYLGGV